MFNTQEEIYYTVILVSIFFILLIGIIIVTAFLYYNRRKVHQQEIAKFQNALLQTQLEIQEQTFKTISQEIHDNIGQVLSLAKLNLNRIDVDNLEPKAEEKISDAKELVSKAIQDLRDLSKTLNTENIASIGLLKAVELELAMIKKAGLINTDLNINGSPKRLHSQKELILFRIVQEALHNIIKHAAATTIVVDATFTLEQFQLFIKDDGQGFDLDNVDRSGSGLSNIQSRTKLIGGDFIISSSKEKGTQIQISIPIT